MKEETNCCTIPQLCQDIYNCILSHVSCLHVIRNMSISNTMLYDAIKYVEYIDGDVLLKFLANEKYDITFPHLKEVRGDIIVHPRLYDDNVIIERLLKLTNIKKLRIKCNFSGDEMLYYNNALRGYDYESCEAVCNSLINYSLFSHLFDFFQLSYEDDYNTACEIYKLTRKDKLTRIEFIENTTYLDSNKIFIPFLEYEYSIVLSFDTSLFLSSLQYNNSINISTLIITKTTKDERIPDIITQIPSIKTIIIESEDVESSFFNECDEIFPHITKIITNYLLLYSNSILDSENRIKKLLQLIKYRYRNAKIHISVYEDELLSLDSNILHHPNAIIKYEHKIKR